MTDLTEMIENKVEVCWSLVRLQSLVAGSEDCEVRVEVLSVRSLSPHQPAELQSGSGTLYHSVSLSLTSLNLSSLESLCRTFSPPAEPRMTVTMVMMMTTWEEERCRSVVVLELLILFLRFQKLMTVLSPGFD